MEGGEAGGTVEERHPGAGVMELGEGGQAHDKAWIRCGGTGGEGESDLEAEDSFGREPEDPPLHKKASRRARGAATPTRKKD